MQPWEYQEEIEIDGVSYPIRTDYRDIMTILVAFEDKELSNIEQIQVLYEILFEYDKPLLTEEVINKCMLFISGDLPANTETSKPLYKWSKDSNYIITGVSKVVGENVKRVNYLHWHDFLGYFMEIGECMFSNIVSIRKHKQEGKLTKDEREYYNKNKDLIDCIYEEENLSLEDLIKLAEIAEGR